METNFNSIPVSNFYGRKTFATLQDAEEAIENYTRGEIDVVCLPPEPDIVTDEEDLDDDNLSVDQIPRDVPGFIEVDFGDNAESNEWSESDEEPLSNKRQRIRNSVKKTHNWKRNEPVYNTFLDPESTGVATRLAIVKADLKNCNPKDIFEKIFGDDVFQYIVDQTNLYAHQNNKHDFAVTLDEMKSFIAILFLSGYHKLPQQKMYWSLDEDLGVSVVSNSMSRNRFLEIKRYIHLADNAAIDKNDRMYKLRAFMNILNGKFRQWGIFHKRLSIDEAMVKYFGHHSAKQFIRGKPVRFGFKDWMMCSSTGYCYAFDTYCGKNNSSSEESRGLGANVVLALLQHLESPQDHVIFFDNFFTTLDLMQILKTKKIRATGTIRENRQKKCPLESSKEMTKKERGHFDYRFDCNNEILLVKWKDNSVCSMATNYDFIEPVNKVKRWSRVKRAMVLVNQPLVFKNYNTGMGGVDLTDQSVNTYRIGIRGKKWWWSLFTHMVNVSMTNAWKLHQICAEESEKMTQLEFTRSVTRHYLRVVTKSKRNNRSSLPSSIALDNVGHFAEKMEKQLRCALCHARIRWRCKKCVITLCIERDCFEKYHTK